MLRTIAILIYVIFITITLPASASVNELPGLISEPMTIDITLPNSQMFRLESFVVRPACPGPFPLIIINHGKGKHVRLENPNTHMAEAVHFAQQGMVSVILMRRGYGNSDGFLAEDVDPGGLTDYLRVGEAGSDDILAALDVLRNQPWVDPERVILSGVSAGGFAVLASSARNPKGVIGILNFAGGFSVKKNPSYLQPMLQAMNVFGRTAKIPSLWIYAENDSYFPPIIAHQMFDSYTSHGAPSKFLAFPPFGNEGHYLDSLGINVWQSEVNDFLTSLSLPTKNSCH